MDGILFDRLARALGDGLPRRGAVRTLAGGSVAALLGHRTAEEDLAKKRHRKNKKKKKERKIGQTCGGQKKCSQTEGPAVCQSFRSSTCAGVTLGGSRCCGLEGAACDPNFGVTIEPHPVESVGNCSCCDPLFCGKQPNGEFRCQVEVT